MAQEEDDLLKDKLLHMGLEDRDVIFIINKGEKFIGHPEILAKKLGIDVKLAEKALVELKAHKKKQISLELERFKQMVEENPDTSVEEVALLYDINEYVVSVYLDYLKTKKLTEVQKCVIKEKHNTGLSIKEIAEQIKESQITVREYVEQNCITFDGTNGERILEIISKNFEKQSIMKLREMILNKNVKLQEKLCWDLEETNPKEYEEVKQYFENFEESQSFFDKTATTLSIKDKTCIRTSSLEDIEQLSIRLNRDERVARNFLLQYSPDENLMQHQTEQQRQKIQHLHAEFGLDSKITHITYRIIISNSFENLIENTKTSKEMSPKRIFGELLPLAFYYLKCSLPLKEFSQIMTDLTNISLTTLDIFHLIFQMSDPVVRGLCIEHYSFSNPIPFYYPRLNSHFLNLKQKFDLQEQNICQFEICKELWYSIQQFNGLVSFGLGWASWNPIGKSHLLDLMFETDFVKGSPQISPFHLNSIDIQMTKNLFGKRKKTTHESTQWAYIDCHGCSDTNVIRDICQNLDIALVHVSYSDYEKNYTHLQGDLDEITANTKHVYVFVRDCPESHQDILQVKKSGKTKFLFIPNLTKCDMQFLLTPLKKFGYAILHSTVESPRLVESNFLENLINQHIPWNTVDGDKILIEMIKNTISSHIKDSSENKFSFLSYYPHFIKYMLYFYKASNEVDQEKFDELNEKCVNLQNILKHTNMSKIVEQFNDILSQENSTLILWKLSQELSILSKKLLLASNTVYTLEILWREAVLSSMYYVDKGDSDNTARSFVEKFSSSFSKHVERGDAFELIDGDNLRFFNHEIDALLSPLYKKINSESHNKRPPIVISIFGPQSSGKSTLLNYCFGCKFLTSAGRCTKGVYASLSKLSRPINHSDHLLILDTEGLDAIEKAKTVQDTSCINFDRTMVLFCLAVSQAVIINVKGDIGEEMRNLLQICAYSLNKLKVSKVAAPKIFFVLNQQTDPDPEKHLSSMNALLDKLNKESNLMETEGTNISDLIQVSNENLFVLPPAFNSETINTQMSKLFDSDLFKLSPTESFANKCADLRISIIHQLDNMHSHNTPFNTMSEWMEMSGVIWDTIIKYQDIVKYRNTEELKCSILLHKIVDDLMTSTIYRNTEEYQNITEHLTHSINNITKWRAPNVVLEDVKKGLDEVFNQYRDKALTDFSEKCHADPLLKRMEYMHDDYKLNMNRLIYMEKKIYEDKLKLAIKARLTEIKQSESMLKLQQDIEANADTYFELSIDLQENVFEDVWIKCFENENKEGEEDAEHDEKLENLYSVFMIESKTMEKKEVMYTRFRQSKFNMTEVIRELEREMLSKFCSESNKGTEQFIYPWRESRTPLKEMTPYLGNKTCQYLHRNSLFYAKDDNEHSEMGKNNLKLRGWVPSECLPLIKYCSGYYNHPDIIWNTEKREQILLLASQMKDPDNSNRSTWEKLINDIRLSVEEFIEKYLNISHSTVKDIVNFLCQICRIVNYEINYIEAKLTIAAERTISTYAFALAFKSLLERKMEKREKELGKKEETFKYFLRKVKNLKLARGNWDRKERRNSEIIAYTFARKFIAGLWRGINTSCEQSIDEEYFDKEKDKLSHKSILLIANTRIKRMLLHTDEPVDEHNFVVQFICNRTQCLKSLFQEEWKNVADKLHDKICGNMEENFNQKIVIVKNILEEFMEQLKTMCTEKNRLEEIGTDSDSCFETTDQAAIEEDNTNSKIRVIPLKAMVYFLKMYLDPKVSPQAFKQFFNNDFGIDGVKVRKHSITYVLFEKPKNSEHILDEETFKKLSDTNMFGSTEEIFNIEVYLHKFLDALNSYQFRLTKAEYENLLKATKEKFEARIINCPRQCPGCGKFCEKEIHPNGGKCQIMTGHQMCSMGGNVWNTDKDRTAVLLMCEDYMNHSPVLIPGQNMTWGEFKEKFCNEWNWDLPTDNKYVVLLKENHETMKKIWKIFGKEILTYYRNRGTQISYIPYTSPKEIYESLFSPIYYVCFLVDGTMVHSIKHVKRWISDVMKDLNTDRSNIKVIVYHGHAFRYLKCIEMFPNSCEFTSDQKSIENFLETIEPYGKTEDLLAMLDGVATATTKCRWKSGFGIKNVIIHYYSEPTKGHFNIFNAEGNCDQGCNFDWQRDINNEIQQSNIDYKSYRLISTSHPEFNFTTINLIDERATSTSDVTVTSGEKESKHVGHVFIDLKKDF